MGHGFDTRLGCRINGIGRLVEPDYAGGETNDPSALTEALSCFTHAIEYALEVDCNFAIDQFVARLSNRREQHNSSIINQHIYSAEFLLRSVKKASNGVRVAHIGLDP